MLREVGTITALYRYPVKSMAGESVESLELLWHGLVGDRRLAFRRVGETNGFPWLTASKLPELILFKPQTPHEIATGAAYKLPTHVTTPEGTTLELHGEELRSDIARRFKAEVELMHLKHGIFDEAPLSMISRATMNAIKHNIDVRRFRPNIVIETIDNEPFREDSWVGERISFGENGARMNVIMKDERCMMINLDPETAQSDASIMKSVVQRNNNCAGVYGTVLQTGTIAVGQKIYL
ncbi:MAG: MOSC domain-containing protein [Candidatus Kapabacteria bacterium]|nr:MOSC domain-containing protein [Candidatus Kapabacteria bacterium]